MQMNEDIILSEDMLYENDDFFNDEEDIALDLLAIDGEMSPEDSEEGFDQTVREFDKFNYVRPIQNRLFAPCFRAKK